MNSVGIAKISLSNVKQPADLDSLVNAPQVISASHVATPQVAALQVAAVRLNQSRSAGSSDADPLATRGGVLLVTRCVKRRARRRRQKQPRRSGVGNDRAITLSLRGRAAIKGVWRRVCVAVLACVLVSGCVVTALASLPRSNLELKLSLASGMLSAFALYWLLLMLLLIAYWPVVELLRLLFTEIELSSQELVVRHGVLVREELRIAMPMIVDVSLHQDVLDAVLGVYTLALEMRLGEGDSKFALPGVQLLEGLKTKKLILEQLPQGVSYSF